jgi:hypothetical protein
LEDHGVAEDVLRLAALQVRELDVAVERSFERESALFEDASRRAVIGVTQGKQAQNPGRARDVDHRGQRLGGVAATLASVPEPCQQIRIAD